MTQVQYYQLIHDLLADISAEIGIEISLISSGMIPQYRRGAWLYSINQFKVTILRWGTETEQYVEGWEGVDVKSAALLRIELGVAISNLQDSWSYRVAHGPDRELQWQIRTRFRELYEAKGKPSGAALYEGVDSLGYFGAMCITPAAAQAFPELLYESSPWSSHNQIPAILHWGWIDGDEKFKPDIQ